MKKVLFVLLSALSYGSYAQTTAAPDLVKAKAYADEVFANCTIFAGPSYIPDYAEIISRISVITEPQAAQESYSRLSTVMLKNKCNPQMTRDESNFSPSHFNPLKYFLNYYPKVDTKYRVDNSNYVILVHPKP
ncbi:hypothetical protein [Taibaiella koreensis]|uniref:hypothetical protein n=1 Tax=Taibaiella koreensis TaxID=1268548 RepID=UPI000E59E0B1|nr:hypothetical protein [Taibaiella koreensis]